MTSDDYLLAEDIQVDITFLGIQDGYPAVGLTGDCPWLASAEHLDLLPRYVQLRGSLEVN